MNSRFVSQAVLGVLSISVLGAAIAGFFLGIPAFLLGLASGALSLVIVLMWGSLQQMEESDEMEFEQALSYAAPSAEEEQKRALLRTLKDLEYELSVGKISREDYDQIYAEVADKAKRMIALTDDAMKARLERAEARVTSRLKAKPQAEVRAEEEAAPPEAAPKESSSEDSDQKDSDQKEEVRS